MREQVRLAVALAAAAATLGASASGEGIAAAAVSARPAASSSAAPSGGSSLEAAASKAGNIGRKVAMSLLALGLAIAAIVLAFKRDFREAAGVFAIGIVAVLLATPAGLNLLRSIVGSLFGGG